MHPEQTQRVGSTCVNTQTYKHFNTAAPCFIPGALKHVTLSDCSKVHVTPHQPSVSRAPAAVNYYVLKFFYFNARSIRTKLADLHDLLYNSPEKHKVICITETWLSSKNFPSGLLDPEGKYQIFRYDRDSTAASGGVCIMVENSIDAAFLNVNPTGPFGDIELVACRIKFGSMYLSLSCIYLAPNISPEDYSRGIQCLSNLYKSEGLHLTVVDFNLPKIGWQTQPHLMRRNVHLSLNFV